MVKPQWSLCKVTLYHGQPAKTRLDHGPFDPTNLIRHAWKKPDPIWTENVLNGLGQNFQPAISFEPAQIFHLKLEKPNMKIIDEKSGFIRPNPITCQVGLRPKFLARWSDQSGTGRRKKPTGFFWPNLNTIGPDEWLLGLANTTQIQVNPLYGPA